MVHDRSNLREFETTAIDSGTIWTTERIYQSESNPQVRKYSPRDETVVSKSPGLNRNYDVTIPRPYFDADRHKSEISDEFRFLDDRPSLPTKISRFYQQKRLSFHYRKPMFIAVAILQIVMAVCLFIFAIIRYKRIYNNAEADLLLDFVKAEDFASSNNEGTAIIAMKVGSCLFIPVILQFITGLCGLFPVYKRPPKFVMVINLLLSSFALKLLFEPVILVAFELNLRNVQLVLQSDDANYRLLIAVVTIIAIFLIFLNAASVVHAASQLIDADNVQSSLFDLHVNMVTIVFAIISICFSAYATANSLTNVSSWPSMGLRNQAALYGFGLRELIICSFIMFCSIFGGFAAVVKSGQLRFGSLALQIVSILLVFDHLLTGDRILAVSHNIDKLFRATSTIPFSPEIPLLLYIFILLMTISLFVQLVPTTMNIFKRRAYDYYDSTAYSVPRPLYQPQNIQRSAL
uniref:Uncharacterized protein n=1 Tax=Panagrolaimus sp. JU765 TaxID=591449 RepID=A0AC34RJV3_9BILA